MKLIKKFNKKCTLVYALILSLFMNIDTVFASSLTNNNITNGLKNLTKDATNVLMGLASGIAVLMVVYYLIKKKFCEDEMESKQYNKKIIGVLICYILIMSAGVIMQIITYYFKISSSI